VSIVARIGLERDFQKAVREIEHDGITGDVRCKILALKEEGHSREDSIIGSEG